MLPLPVLTLSLARLLPSPARLALPAAQTGTEALPAKITPTACPDLVISDLRITQRSRSRVALQVTLINTGQLNIDSTNVGRGAIINFYASGGERVGNAAKLLLQLPLSNAVSTLNGRRGLQAGTSMTLVETLDLEGVTKYSGVLVAQVDPGQVIRECDETNNEAHTLLFE